MKRNLITSLSSAAALSCLLALPSHATTQTWFGFSVGVSGGNAPPPIVWRAEPRVVYVNQVAVVDDDACPDDVFRYGNSWYRMRDGWWFRASSWRGPWATCDVRRVPESVLVVPSNRWKHHPHGGPPGQMKRGVVVVEEHGHGHGHGRGHGYGDHDHD